ncbi:MAG: hypothetical protein LBN39_00945 [Planctomycetaceae bacterium]|jgi:hypothetical protein|nr:hypothetical protein [Planctomycetaceae bacterium]
MKLVKLPLAVVFAVLTVSVAGWCAEEAPQHISCNTPNCNNDCNGTHANHNGVHGGVHSGTHAAVCPAHGANCLANCPHRYLKNEYSYGRQEVCPGKTSGVCPVHGYAPCPHPNQAVGPFLRQAFAPADRPYFGAQPLYVSREQYDPGFQPRFPRFRALFVMPVGADARYMTTSPPAQMDTYTTRAPRDFLMPNPPSIGY